MRSRFRSHNGARSVLSLILLAANVGAPIRTSDVGRPLLAQSGRHATTRHAVRVRALSSVGVSHGFRAVVGVRGGSDRPGIAADTRAFPTFLPSSAGPVRRPQARPSSGPLNPPLRC